jgi:3-oxoacyl-[acyl-carrier protein] reductase
MGNLLHGKVALVTGGNTGIGKGIVEAFAREGASLAVNFLEAPESSKILKHQVEKSGVRCSLHEGDVTDEIFVKNMIAEIINEFGKIDILVNNAGILKRVWFKDMTIEDWDRMIAVHMRGTFLCTKFTIVHMLSRKQGKIINIASQLGQIGRESWVHYSAAKAGIIGFTKALSREVASEGIYVNAIAPGPIDTGAVSLEHKEKRTLEESLPIKRLGEVNDVAPTAVFLASNNSNFYVGQTLGPNGGDVML